MSDRQFLDAHSGVVENFIWDEADQRAGIQITGDVESVFDANKAAGDGWSKSREWRLVARIPTAIYYKWLAEYGVDPLAKENGALLQRLLNDPENAHLRVGTGRVAIGAKRMI